MLMAHEGDITKTIVKHLKRIYWFPSQAIHIAIIHICAHGKLENTRQFIAGHETWSSAFTLVFMICNFVHVSLAT